MKLLLPYFILIWVMLQLIIRKNTKRKKDSEAAYWERENKSNLVRKKDISKLNYIEIPDLPYIDTDDEQLLSAQDTIRSLKDAKILNLTGISNTDLKLEYGVANLTVLTEYDNNFTELVRAIAKAGHLLLKNGHEPEGIEFLKFGVSIQSDISSNYIDLAKYYSQHGDKKKIHNLIQHASLLNSMIKDSLIKKLNAYLIESSDE